MALINHEKKEINAKIVFYGPGSSGKTTNVKFLYEKMKPEFRGKLKFLNTRSGKLLFFDFKRPDQIAIQDYDVRFHVYTVQGEITDYAVWKTVLKGMDGLVFVTDSEPYRMPDNLQYFERLTEYMETLGEGIKDIPCLLQCNKQDLPGATTVEEMKELLHSIDCPIIPASAKKGEGVLSTLSNIVRMVLQKLRETPLEVGQEGKPAAETQTPAPDVKGEEMHPGEPALIAEDILSTPLTDTAPQQEFVPGFATRGFDRTEPEPSMNISEPDLTTSEVDTLSEEIQEAPMERVSTPDEEIICEQPPEFISFGGFASEATQQSAESEEINHSAEISEPEIIAADINFVGEMEQVAPGHLRLPVTVRYGRDTKKIAINLKISVESMTN